jgi:hypothetical protein
MEKDGTERERAIEQATDGNKRCLPCSLEHRVLETVRLTADKARLLLFRGEGLPRKSVQSSSLVAFVNCPTGRQQGRSPEFTSAPARETQKRPCRLKRKQGLEISEPVVVRKKRTIKGRCVCAELVPNPEVSACFVKFF